MVGNKGKSAPQRWRAATGSSKRRRTLLDSSRSADSGHFRGTRPGLGNDGCSSDRKPGPRAEHRPLTVTPTCRPAGPCLSRGHCLSIGRGRAPGPSPGGRIRGRLTGGRWLRGLCPDADDVAAVREATMAAPASTAAPQTRSAPAMRPRVRCLKAWGLL